MSFGYFFKKSFLLFALYAILLAFLLQFLEISSMGLALGAGLVISFLNSVAGFATISYGFGKPDKTFYGFFFGGMLIRFLLMFFILFLLIKGFQMAITPLVISLLITYFSFLILEIWSVHKLAGLKGNEI